MPAEQLRRAEMVQVIRTVGLESGHEVTRLWSLDGELLGIVRQSSDPTASALVVGVEIGPDTGIPRQG